MTYQVSPHDLHAGSRIVGRATGDLSGLSGDLTRVFRALADAAESPEVGAAGLSAARRWGPAGESLAGGARALAGGLGRTAAGYAAAETEGVRRFRVER